MRMCSSVPLLTPRKRERCPRRDTCTHALSRDPQILVLSLFLVLVAVGSKAAVTKCRSLVDDRIAKSSACKDYIDNEKKTKDDSL